MIIPKPCQINLHYLKFRLLIANFVSNLTIEIKEEKRTTEVMLGISPEAENELFFHILLLINILRANPFFSPLGFTLHGQFSAAEEAYCGETWQGNPSASPNTTRALLAIDLLLCWHFPGSSHSSWLLHLPSGTGSTSTLSM